MPQFSRFYLALAVLFIGSVAQFSPSVLAFLTNETSSGISGKIAFLSSRDHVCNSDGMCNETIYMMNADGSNQQRLIESKFWAVTSSLSPDSTQIVFVSPWFGQQAIYLVATSGENLRQLTYDSDTVFLGVSWSPDNRQLGFTSGSVEYGNTTLRRRNREVYVIDADGSHKKALTNTGWNEFLFWSADTTSIIFMSDRSGSDEVYVMNVRIGIKLVLLRIS